MGRFVSGGGAVPRKQSIRLLASNPTVAIPSWARVAYITGTAAGGGGGNGTGAVDRGAGGGAGGYSVRTPLQITSETTMAVVIGAPGTGGTTGGNPGGNAGNTTVTLANVQLRLQGGGGGSGGAGNTGGAGGVAIIGRPDDPTAIPSVAAAGNPYGGNSGSIVGATGVNAAASTLGNGANGAGGNTTARGAGGLSIFGGAGRQSESVNTANQPGFATSGYGGGGGGGNGTGAGTDGAPGFILIEFEEAT